MEFVTLAMLIIDEIHFLPPEPPRLEVLGGAGTWSVLGARLFRPSPASQQIGWTVHRGSDFPQHLTREIGTWDTTCNFIETPERLTTRGWNKYGEDEHRAFKYLTPKLRVDETQLNEPLLRSRCFHIISTPSRCVDLVKGIMARRQGLSVNGTRPFFVWEPVPDACKPEELSAAFAALQHIDVISPNHQELESLFSLMDEPITGEVRLERQCQRLMSHFRSRQGAVVVRCGEQGSLVATAETRSWLPAYHLAPEFGTHAKVVDPTGAGNAFLGGFCINLQYTGGGEANWHERVVESAAYGSVAASFAIEQVGLPGLDASGVEEKWNGESVKDRLAAFQNRVSERPQLTATTVR